MITLAIDASTYAGDVAVLGRGRMLAEQSVAMKGANEERLMPAVASVLQSAGVRAKDLDRIVCGAGPGSFTSLRIAGAIAKGLASGLDRPLFAVPSMALIVGGAHLPSGRYLVAVDALRAEWYVGLFEVDEDDSVREVERAKLIAANALHALADDFGASIVSPSELPNAIQASPRARAVAQFESSLAEWDPVDLGGWEPAYGRLAEAQVRWESAHGRPLPAG